MQAFCNGVLEAIELSGVSKRTLSKRCLLPSNKKPATIYARLVGRRAMSFTLLFDIMANGLQLGPDFDIFNKSLGFIHKPK